MGDVRLGVICGPTAAGKSAIALALAARSGTVAAVVSADSRQIYRGFDIGTAKPSAAERARVPHAGIDVADPRERYSAARWAAAARGWIDAAHDGGRQPLIVGGTGFYLQALAHPLFDEPAMEPARRLALETALGTFTLDELRRWCRTLDAARAHLGRTQLLRAIVVAVLAGRRMSDLHASTPRLPRITLRYLVVDPGSALATRIAERVDAMLARGWAAEVERLMAVVPEDAPAWNASGYGEIRRLVRGDTSAALARERVIVETRQYAKRQRTWFRHQLGHADVTRIDPDAADALERAGSWWEAGRVGQGPAASVAGATEERRP